MRIVTVRQLPKRNCTMLVRGLCAFGVVCLLAFVYGLSLPPDWEARFGVLSRPVSLAARLPGIRSFAAASHVPGEIVSGFLGLLCWLHLAFALYFAYWLYFVRQKDGAVGLHATWSDEDLDFTPIPWLFLAWPFFEWCGLLWHVMRAAPQDWRDGPLAGSMVGAMLDERLWLAVWGAFVILPWATLMLVAFLVVVGAILLLRAVMPPIPEALTPDPARPAAARASALTELAALARATSAERQAAFAATLKTGDLNKLRHLALLYAVACERRTYRNIAREIWRHALMPWQQAEALRNFRIQYEQEKARNLRTRGEQDSDRKAGIERELREWAEKDAELRRMQLPAIQHSGSEKTINRLAELYEAGRDRPEYRELAEDIALLVLLPRFQAKQNAATRD